MANKKSFRAKCAERLTTQTILHLIGSLSTELLCFLLPCVVFISLCVPVAESRNHPAKISSEARTYLTNSIDLIRRHALTKETVNWRKAIHDAFAMAQRAQFVSETYCAINLVIERLGDHHSFLLLPDGTRYRDNSIRNTDTQNADITTKPSAKSRSSFMFTRRNEPTGELIKSQKHLIGFLVVPAIEGSRIRPEIREYAENIQLLILSLIKQGAEAWIIDLRGNYGGNFWAMFAGIGPIEGDGDLGGTDNPKIYWFYRNGATGVRDKEGNEFVVLDMLRPLQNIKGHFPIAVLIDQDTASAGEAIALSFHGRKDTKFFGHHTRGLSNVLQEFTLSDGATIELAVAVDTDRNGVSFPKGLAPDVEVHSTPETDNAVNEAIKWIDEWQNTHETK